MISYAKAGIMGLHKGDFMQDLINELREPRSVVIAPSPAAMRASAELQKLYALQQQDLQARLIAEQKLVEAYGQIQALTKELNEKAANNSDASIAASDTSS